MLDRYYTSQEIGAFERMEVISEKRIALEVRRIVLVFILGICIGLSVGVALGMRIIYSSVNMKHLTEIYDAVLYFKRNGIFKTQPEKGVNND